MSIDPVKIPQNVYIEDRIVGPLTLRQIMIIAIGGGFSYAIYSLMVKSMGNPGIVLTVLAWTPCAIAAMFALIKVNDLSLTRICFLLVEQMNKPSKRTFAPRRGISINVQFSSQTKSDKEKKMEKDVDADAKAQQKIMELSSVMDDTFPRVTKNIPEPVEPDDTEEVPVRTSQPVEEDVADDQAEDLPIEADAYRPPVQKNRIGVDKPVEADPYQLRDLSSSVFRDILPPSAQ